MSFVFHSSKQKKSQPSFHHILLGVLSFCFVFFSLKIQHGCLYQVGHLRLGPLYLWIPQRWWRGDHPTGPGTGGAAESRGAPNGDGFVWRCIYIYYIYITQMFGKKAKLGDVSQMICDMFIMIVL